MSCCIFGLFRYCVQELLCKALVLRDAKSKYDSRNNLNNCFKLPIQMVSAKVNYIPNYCQIPPHPPFFGPHPPLSLSVTGNRGHSSPNFASIKMFFISFPFSNNGECSISYPSLKILRMYSPLQELISVTACAY